MFQKLTGPVPCLFYPAVRALGYSVKEALTNARVQADILVKIGETWPVGAVVRMTELWCEAAAFGVAYDMQENDFPRLGEPLCEDAGELTELAIPAAVNPVTAPLIEAVRLARPRMTKPLVVGATGPYTMGSVINGSEDFMMNCMTEDEDVHAFLEKATDFLISYILEYKTAGADAIMIAEPSVAMISPDMVEEFSNAYLQRIIDAVQDDAFAVIYHNCGAVNQHLDVIARLNARAFHFGSDVDLQLAREKLPVDRILMGNLDPRLFIGTPAARVAALTADLAAQTAGLPNYIPSTGCDLSPAAKPEAIEAFLETLQA